MARFTERRPIPAIIKTVPIKEINDQGLANASIAWRDEAETTRSPSSSALRLDVKTDIGRSLRRAGGTYAGEGTAKGRR
jgi:hypothetical protein